MTFEADISDLINKVRHPKKEEVRILTFAEQEFLDMYNHFNPKYLPRMRKLLLKLQGNELYKSYVSMVAEKAREYETYNNADDNNAA